MDPEVPGRAPSAEMEVRDGAAPTGTDSDDGGFDVILFDLGGVLMDFTGLHRLGALTGGLDEASVRSRWAASRWMGAFGRGECDAAEFGDGFVREWGLDRWGVVDHFDWTFVSHELGMTKPDPAVFDHVVRAVGADADRILFLDDADANVRAARRAGMRAEQTRGPQEVRDALRSLLPGDSPAERAVRSIA